jgi:hypothetical protein
VGEFHHPAGLPFKKDDMPATDIGCLHSMELQVIG